MTIMQQKVNAANHNKFQNLLHLLKNGFQEIDPNTPKNITLVLGLTGSYKSDLIQLIAVNKHLNNSWDNTAISNTIFPGLTVDSKTNTAYYNYPEFDVSKTFDEDLSAKYLLNKIIDYAHSIKLVFTIPESLIISSVDAEYINSLLDDFVKMIKNLNKLQDSIALIVTKVDNFIDDKGDLISDENVFKKIRNNLIDFLKKYSTSNKVSSRRKQHLILNMLLRQKYGMYTNVGIFKKPKKFERGLSEYKVLHDNKRSLQKVINANTKFSRYNKNDFQCIFCLNKIMNDLPSGIYTNIEDKVLHDSKKSLEAVINANTKFTMNNKNHFENDLPSGIYDIEEIRRIVSKYCENQEKQIKDFKNLSKRFLDGFSFFNILHGKRLSVKDFLGEFENLEDIRISIPREVILSINNQKVEYSSLERLIQDISHDLHSSGQWYRFLIHFHHDLSNYSIQKAFESNEYNQYTFHIEQLRTEKLTWDDRKMNVRNVFNDPRSKEYIDRKSNIIKNVYKIYEKAYIDKDEFARVRVLLDGATISKVKLFSMSDMLESLFYFSSDETQASCENGKLKIQGRFVKLSDVSKEENLKCNIEEPVKAIELFASNRIFIDSNLNKTGNEVQLSIIAPTWEVIGKHEIILDGLPGQAHKNQITSNIFSDPAKAGKNGKPGKPGGPAGSFLGIGFHFINGTFLDISVKGGLGGPGQNGSDGLLGGVGGAGGMGGKIGGAKLIEVGFGAYFHKSFAEGKVGLAGVSGKALSIKSSTSEMTYNNNLNSNGREPPQSSAASISANVINDYKSYLRSVMIKPTEKFKEGILREFLDRIEKDEDANELYTAMEYINELQSLETQFYEYHKELSFLPFYESLLNRITKYANNIYSNKKLMKDDKKRQKFEDEIRALRYLYAATLSKIVGMRNNKSNNLILKIKAYLDSAVENVNKLNDYKQIKLINEVNNNYHELMDNNINKALNFVPEIMEEIEELLYKVDASIKWLIEEIKSLEKKVENQKNNLKELDEKLTRTIVIRSVFGALNIIGQLLMFAGPLGVVAGLAISGTSMIIESLAVTNPNKNNIKAADLPKALDRNMPDIVELIDKQTIFLKQLEAIEKEFKTTQQIVTPPSSVLELKNSIDNIRREVEKEKLNGSSTKFYERIDEVKQSLKEQATRFGSDEYKNNKQMQVWSKSMNRAVNLISLVQVPINLYKDISSDVENIKLVARAIKESDYQLEMIDMHKRKIYDSIFPRFREIQERLDELSQNTTREKSLVALDISKWKIQEVLKDVKYRLHEMTQGFEVQEGITHFIDKLDHALAIMIDVYDSIQDYRGIKELADYINNINPRGDASIRSIKDKKLKEAIDDLKIIIQSNIVLEEYDRAIKAVKQKVYPLAEDFLTNNPPPFDDSEQGNINALTTKVAYTLEQIKKRFIMNDIEIGTHDEYFYPHASFNVTDIHRGPFYLWNYTENKHAISRLLEGEEITLKSDITKSLPEFSAVKFREIGINFMLPNESITETFYKELKYFVLKITHLGNSQYKCNDKFHVITNDKKTLTIEFDTTTRNAVFAKLKENEPLLSPYTLWKISLIGQHGRGFDSLKKFENMTIDLALEGQGSYFNNSDDTINVKVCNDGLSKYYEEDKTIPALTTTKLYISREILDDIQELDAIEPHHIEKQKNYQRIRRSLNSSVFEQNLEENSFTTNKACSGMKSSFINNIFNLAGTAGLLAYEYLDPTNKIKKWFTKYNTNTDQENIIISDSNIILTNTKMFNIHSPDTELPKVSKMFIDEELPTTDNLLNDSSFCNHGNLLLLDLLIRSKNGVKYSHESIANFNINNDLEYAQHLAYREHIK